MALSGLQGVKTNRGSKAPAPAPKGSASSKTAADNASFDRNCYHDIVKSMVGGKLR